MNDDNYRAPFRPIDDQSRDSKRDGISQGILISFRMLQCSDSDINPLIHDDDDAIVDTARLVMPNWMINEVQITGPDDEIARFRDEHICKDNNGRDVLDFNSIVPMPSDLNDVRTGADVDILVWALGGDLYAEQDPLRRLGIYSGDTTPLDTPWMRERGITTREGLLRWAEKEQPKQLDRARRVMEIERSTGYRSWYDWQLCNWGCKWGCRDFTWGTDDRTAFYMKTPWTAPSPIFRRLVELYPSLTFSCRFVEADNGVDYVETFTV